MSLEDLMWRVGHHPRDISSGASAARLEGDVGETLTGLASHTFIVFHLSWGYFARDFGPEQIPVEVGGQEPSAQELAH